MKWWYWLQPILQAWNHEDIPRIWWKRGNLLKSGFGWHIKEIIKGHKMVLRGRGGLCRIEELCLYIFWFLFCKWGCFQIEGETLLLVNENMIGKNLYWNKYYTCWYSEEVSLPWMSSKRLFQNWYHFVYFIFEFLNWFMYDYAVI